MKKFIQRHSLMLSAIVAGFGVTSSAPARADILDDLIKGALGAFDSAITKALGGTIKAITGALDKAIADFYKKLFGVGDCETTKTIGGAICRLVSSMDTMPGFISAMAYLIGLILAITALLKLQEHVIDSRRTPLKDPMLRFLAGGAMFSLPTITTFLQTTLTGGSVPTLAVSGYAGKVSGGGGLDTMFVGLFRDLYGPMMGALFSFGYLVGIVLTVVGIMRVIKTTQDGPRGPAGFGTIMTFIVAGVLFSAGTIMHGFSVSLFGTGSIATFAVLNTSSGDAAVDDHILAVISTVLVFMTIVGWISFLRGFFILRDVAEGNGQASLMVSLTHMFGGALAVNLGPLLNAVQSTFGLSSLGVSFT